VMPLSVATFCRIAVDSADAGARNVPAGYVLPFIVNGAAVRETGSLALSRRVDAAEGAVAPVRIANGPPVWARGKCAGAVTTSGSFSNGPSNASRIRSNLMPIE